MPSRSLRDPTRYSVQHPDTAAFGISLTRTSKPLSNVCLVIGRRRFLDSGDASWLVGGVVTRPSSRFWILSSCSRLFRRIEICLSLVCQRVSLQSPIFWRRNEASSLPSSDVPLPLPLYLTILGHPPRHLPLP